PGTGSSSNLIRALRCLSSRLSSAQPRNSEPRGPALQSAINGGLNRAQRKGPAGNSFAAGYCFVPDAFHLRPYFTTSIVAHSAAGAVSEVFGAIHRAGHARG